MKSARVVTGVCMVGANHDRCKANNHAGFTGFTGFTGSAAHVRVIRFFCFVSSNKKCLSRARKYNPVNPVNHVKAHINQGFQRIRVGAVVCKTLIHGVFHG